MAILVNKNTRLIVQGLTGHEGLFHAAQMQEYGTIIVAGVSPGKGGTWEMQGKIPIFDSVRMAVEATGANSSIIFVPARAAPDAIYEAAEAGVKLVVCITEGIPVLEMLRVSAFLKTKNTLLVGPNSPGIISPGIAKVGIIPAQIITRGSIGIISRSGTLTYEMLNALNSALLGVSTCVGIGGDPIIGSTYIDLLPLFEDDADTEMVIMIGEIGGSDEERAAEYISNKMTKPVVAFIAGRSSPPGKRMGHAGAIIEGGTGTAASKIQALENAGVKVARHPEEVVELILRGTTTEN
ncbi:MAG: succinate--CoA ligase subunit alpha [Anaerolineaceae bacterium]|nr:succinate--CoA ligase subunit alpha [Anaerolineaceae bacterium]MBN2677174.1 succinate--CoA ligase subunit alpha [Anaerolineaceae bacterium]